MPHRILNAIAPIISLALGSSVLLLFSFEYFLVPDHAYSRSHERIGAALNLRKRRHADSFKSKPGLPLD
jgi:hypothetical protein